MSRIISLGALLWLALLLQACSAVRLAYNQAPDLAYWYLDAYLDFNGTQSTQVRDELTKLQAWHRRTQLPSYLTTLEKLRQHMPADMDAAQACEVLADVRAKLLLVSEHAEPAVVALAATLRPEQLAHMERKFAKGNADYVDDYVEATPRASRSKRYKLAVSRAQMLYGRLDQKQLAVIGAGIDQSQFDATLSYGERLRRQRDGLQTLRKMAETRQAAGTAPAPDAGARQAMRGLFDRSLNSPHPAYRDYFDNLTQHGCKTFASLHNSTSPAQRRKAVATLDGYEQDLKALLASN
ncbi:MAG: hypothetical protein JWQ72_753 [Polaromonas sp.]|nr:hypothetical protein [Polaromonas sp.]